MVDYQLLLIPINKQFHLNTFPLVMGTEYEKTWLLKHVSQSQPTSEQLQNRTTEYSLGKGGERR